ncbi:unnamed protein product, partial [Vicia faba]
RQREEICSYLPDVLWECIFKFLSCDNHTLKSYSVFSKQFLSITNCLRFSVKITDETISFLPRLFHRFPNLTSLELTILSKTVEEVDDILALISTFPLDIKSLNLSKDFYSKKCIQIPVNGLIPLSKTMKNLKSLTFHGMSYFNKKNLFLIAEYFPLLKKLNLTYPRVRSSRDFFINHNDPLLALPNLREIDLSGNHISDQFIDFLYHSCKLLHKIVIIDRISRKPGEFGIQGKYYSSDIVIIYWENYTDLH